MPARGRPKRNPTGKAPQIQIGLKKELYDALDKLGKANNIVNPRNGAGNRTRVIERLFAILPAFSQAKAVIEMSLEYLPPDELAIANSVLLKLEELEIE